MRGKGAPIGESIAAIALRQHGVISFAQLRSLGLSADAVFHRTKTCTLVRIHHRVYALGNRGLSSEGKWMAAVLACEPPAVLSHRSAAALWGMLPFAAGPSEIVIPGGGGRRRQRGILRHRSRNLTDRHVTRRKGIPVTIPSRTIVDLQRICGPAEVRRAVRQAEMLGLRLGGGVSAGGTRSELEHRFLTLCRHQRLPEPEVNVPLAGFTVDFLWREESLVVETDGYRYHRGALAFESDRGRDLELRILGYEVVRFTYRQVTEQPEPVVRLLRRRLRERST